MRLVCGLQKAECLLFSQLGVIVVYANYITIEMATMQPRFSTHTIHYSIRFVDAAIKF